jgi:hypothetical protein
MLYKKGSHEEKVASNKSKKLITTLVPQGRLSVESKYERNS